MSDIAIGLIQAALLLAVGHFTGRRALLAAVAIAAAAASLAIGYPASLARPWPEIVAGGVGAVAGALVGWFAIRAREKRLSTSIRDRAVIAAARKRAGGTGKGVAFGLVASMLAATAAALYVEDAALQSWRGTARSWLNAPAPAPAPRAMAPASRAAAPGRGTPAASAGKPVVAGHPAAGRDAAPPVATRASAPDARAERRPQGGLPQGDLRHCLEHPSPPDVLRCAER
jgi:hypothetical protein